MMLEQCPDSILMGVTYHRGTQRSYIFVLHPEKQEFYRDLLKEFLETYKGRAVILVDGHFVFADGRTYWSFLRNAHDPVVHVWHLKEENE